MAKSKRLARRMPLAAYRSARSNILRSGRGERVGGDTGTGMAAAAWRKQRVVRCGQHLAARGDSGVEWWKAAKGTASGVSTQAANIAYANLCYNHSFCSQIRGGCAAGKITWRQDKWRTREQPIARGAAAPCGARSCAHDAASRRVKTSYGRRQRHNMAKTKRRGGGGRQNRRRRQAIVYRGVMALVLGNGSICGHGRGKSSKTIMSA